MSPSPYRFYSEAIILNHLRRLNLAKDMEIELCAYEHHRQYIEVLSGLFKDCHDVRLLLILAQGQSFYP